MFGDLLRHAPACRGLTQGQIAERLAARGEKVAQTTVSAWHRGAAIPRDPKRLAVIAAVYGLPKDLVFREAFSERPKKKPARTRAGRSEDPASPRDDEIRETLAVMQGLMEEAISLLRRGDEAALEGARSLEAQWPPDPT